MFVRHKFVTIKQVLGQENPDISFRRDLFGPRLAAWNELLTRLEDIQLTSEMDKFRWKLHQNNSFSVKSLYDAMTHIDVPVDKKNMEAKNFSKSEDIPLFFKKRGHLN